MPTLVGFTHKYHPHPRLSANQIADYVFSVSAVKRRSILRAAKYPAIMIVIKYDEARTAVEKHLAENGTGQNILVDALLSLQRKIDSEESTEGKKKNCKLSIDAIEAFQLNEGALGIEKTTFKQSPIHNTKLLISGVTVSVSLDLVAEKINSDGKKSVGAVVLVFSKTGGKEKNIEERCKTIAVLVCEVMKEHFQSDGLIEPKLCMAIDVFGGKVYRAKKQQKQLLANLETSCEDVATMWPSVKPPKNYKGPPITKS